VRSPGILRVHALAAPGGFAAESNPLVVLPQTPRVLWGDLHGHSNLSDGSGSAEDYFRYARDIAGLDLAVLTDHDHVGRRHARYDARALAGDPPHGSRPSTRRGAS